MDTKTNKEIKISTRDMESGLMYMANPYQHPYSMEGHPKYADTFELIIDEDGKAYEVPNGHQQALIAMCAIKEGTDLTAIQMGEKCSDIGFWYEWMLKLSGCALIYPDRASANKFTEKQKETLKEIQRKGYIGESYMLNELGYNGVYNERKIYSLKRDA